MLVTSAAAVYAFCRCSWSAPPAGCDVLAAVRAGDVQMLRKLLAAGPALRSSRRNRMGAISSARGEGGSRTLRRGEGAATAIKPTALTVAPQEYKEIASALFVATQLGHEQCVQLLLEWGADPNVNPNPNTWVRGSTAFHVGCWHDQTECVEALIRAGCDAAAEDSTGRTGRMLAEQRGNHRVLALLDGPMAALKKQRQVEKKKRRKKEARKRKLLEQAIQLAPSKGLYMEFGVASGQSINFIASRVPRHKFVHGFDSFEGLPEDWRMGCEAGFFNLDGAKPEVCDNVKLYPGWFDQTLPDFLMTTRAHEDGIEEQVAFLHIDSDIYSSCKLILSLLAARLRRGTVIVSTQSSLFIFHAEHSIQYLQYRILIPSSHQYVYDVVYGGVFQVFDEWDGYEGWEEHEARAWDEFQAEHTIAVEWLLSLDGGGGGGSRALVIQ